MRHVSGSSRVSRAAGSLRGREFTINLSSVTKKMFSDPVRLKAFCIPQRCESAENLSLDFRLGEDVGGKLWAGRVQAGRGRQGAAGR